jgi:RNA polymerase sigma factor (sigma-70 family)
MDTQAHALLGAKDHMDETNWEAVYQQEMPRIYNYFRYRIGHGPLAEDLTAITFEKAWRGRWRYRRKLAAFSTWLFTIARNVAADHFRRPHSESPLDDLHQQTNSALVEETVQRKDEISHLAALLAQLPGRERELVAFKFGAELSNRKIARLTHLSESNVGTILNRVIQKLRQEWEVEDER